MSKRRGRGNIGEEREQTEKLQADVLNGVGGGRGRGSGRGGGVLGSGSGGGIGGLVVRRFRPGVPAAPQHVDVGGSSGSTAQPVASRDSGEHDVQESDRTKRRRKSSDSIAESNQATVKQDAAVPGAEHAEVNSTFAKIFKGGPKRAQAGFLEVKEDEEGVQEVPEPLPAAGDESGGGFSWLSSLGVDTSGAVDSGGGLVDDEAGAAESTLELNWLGSLNSVAQKTGAAPTVAVSASAAAAPDREAAVGPAPKPEEWLAQAAAPYVGKALPIPPFWRTGKMSRLQKELLAERPLLLSRMRRMAKDARRAAEKNAGRGSGGNSRLG